jgi:hypothetical protein
MEYFEITLRIPRPTGPWYRPKFRLSTLLIVTLVCATALAPRQGWHITEDSWYSHRCGWPAPIYSWRAGAGVLHVENVVPDACVWLLFIIAIVAASKLRFRVRNADAAHHRRLLKTAVLNPPWKR